MRGRGFSLVECVVAATVLAAGLLAVAATVRSGQRLAREGALRARAVELASSRLARLSREGCGAAGGAQLTGEFTETWTVAAQGAVRSARVGVSFAAAPGEARHMVVTLDFLCGEDLP